MIIGIIPARYASTRLPGKPLIDLEGQSMIERVWRAASSVQAFDRVIIATDSEHIVAEAQRFKADVVLTSPDEPSGTDRCYAAVRSLGITPDIVVNIQGDEPLLQPTVLLQCIDALQQTTADVATPVVRIASDDVLRDPNVVKAVRAHDGRALYFSRSPIPYLRDAAGSWSDTVDYWQHVGLYAYRMHALTRHVMLAPSPLERAESLEQLRLLEDGATFTCVETQHRSIAVDTPEDAERVRALLRAQHQH